MATVKKASSDAALKERAVKAQKIAGSDAPDRTHKYLPTFKAPKSVALAADALWKKQQERKQAQAVADALEAEEADLKAWIIEELPKSQATGVAGKLCRVTAGRKEVARVEDWPKFYAGVVAEYQSHMRRKDGQQDGAFSLLQRRIGEAAVKERWENGVAIAGVGKFTATTLSITKV